MIKTIAQELTKVYFEGMTELLQHRPYEAGETGEGSHSPFLTNRESAELTALSTLGPLALVAFDTGPEAGIPRAPEVASAPEVPDTIGEVDGFDRVELLHVIEQQQGMARAALLFAERSMN